MIKRDITVLSMLLILPLRQVHLEHMCRMYDAWQTCEGAEHEWGPPSTVLKHYNCKRALQVMREPSKAPYTSLEGLRQYHGFDRYTERFGSLRPRRFGGNNMCKRFEDVTLKTTQDFWGYLTCLEISI
jgi:hypothetical protein